MRLNIINQQPQVMPWLMKFKLLSISPESEIERMVFDEYGTKLKFIKQQKYGHYQCRALTLTMQIALTFSLTFLLCLFREKLNIFFPVCIFKLEK